MNFEEQLSAKVEQVNRSLLEALPNREVKPARLHEAIRHSSEAGGKRLRPVLLLAAHDLFPGMGDPMAAALAIECIHTYSLIHDDLPAMDDSDTRRGQPSCHKAFDEATAILAGDALQPMAFELLAKGYHYSPEVAVDLVRMLAETAGSEQLVGGQMQDLLSEGAEPDAETLGYIHQNKTAAMIRASLQMGFRLGEKGGDLALMGLMAEAGLSLGLAFQAVDDLLDVTRTSEELGKDAAHDAESGKVTWVGLLGERKARELATKHTEDALGKLEEVGGDNAFLLELVKRMLDRTH
ncbi:MAG: polyprenyl synthetase [Verrucomicrobia bacterium TMED175]|nr:MAG: polyprenyl synthetase [Verrucomicrobia bacterium TMED175]